MIFANTIYPVMTGIILVIATICIDLFTDIRLFYKKKKVNHTRGALLRLIGLIPAVYFMGWLSIPMIGFWYMVLFNGIYNIFIGKRWEFVGVTARLDVIQRKHPWLKYVKYIGLILSTILYILL
ncbi:MAG: hypothetical protein ABI675_19425 [Chitinophagaceae bacterium]